MSNLRRIKGRQSPRMRRWSISYLESRPLLDWVRDQRETLDWARGARQLQQINETTGGESQSVQQGRPRQQHEEERMTQSARGGSSTQRELDEIRRNPLEMSGSSSPQRRRGSAPVAVVNVNNNRNTNDDQDHPRSSVSVDNSELHSVNENEAYNGNEEEQGLSVTSTLDGSPGRVNSQAVDGTTINAATKDTVAPATPSPTKASRMDSPLQQQTTDGNESTGGSSIARQIVAERARVVATQAKQSSVVAQLVVRRRSALDHEQPGLIPSTTDDTDDRSSRSSSRAEPPMTLREALAQEQDARIHQDRRETIEYLLQYETMVLQQEAEEIATLTYIRPLLERLEALGKGTEYNRATFSQNTNEESLYNDLCQRTISFGELQKVLQVLEREQGTTTTSAELLIQDQQLMMILRLLNQKHHSSEEEDIGITWAEIIHCYRVCVLGMSTLKHMPKQEGSKHVRSRAKDRILSQLSLFELPATKLLNEPTIFDDDKESDESPIKGVKLTRRRQNMVALATVFMAAATMGFLAGSNYYKPAERSPTVAKDVNVAFAMAPPDQEMTAPIEQQYLIEFCPAKAPAIRPDNFTNQVVPDVHLDLPKMRANLPHVIPQEEQEQRQPHVDVKAMPVANLNQTTAMGETRKHWSETKVEPKAIWQSLTPRQQAAASALMGAATGLVAPPQLIALYQALGASALSLSSLGVLPGTLVVVGAVAVSINFVKGVHLVMRRILNLRGL